MALGVVDGLEVVQVEQQQCAVLLVAAAGQQGGLHPFAQQAAVGQLRERVVIGQRVDGFGVGVQRDLHGLQRAHDIADFVAATDVDGGVKLAGFDVVKHLDDVAQRPDDGANQQYADQAQQCHGREQRADGNPPSLPVALHASAIGVLGSLQLQVDQRLDFSVGALVQDMGA